MGLSSLKLWTPKDVSFLQ